MGTPTTQTGDPMGLIALLASTQAQGARSTTASTADIESIYGNLKNDNQLIYFLRKFDLKQNVFDIKGINGTATNPKADLIRARNHQYIIAKLIENWSHVTIFADASQRVHIEEGQKGISPFVNFLNVIAEDVALRNGIANYRQALVSNPDFKNKVFQELSSYNEKFKQANLEQASKDQFAKSNPRLGALNELGIDKAMYYELAAGTLGWWTASSLIGRVAKTSTEESVKRGMGIAGGNWLRGLDTFMQGTYYQSYSRGVLGGSQTAQTAWTTAINSVLNDAKNSKVDIPTGAELYNKAKLIVQGQVQQATRGKKALGLLRAGANFVAKGLLGRNPLFMAVVGIAALTYGMQDRGGGDSNLRIYGLKVKEFFEDGAQSVGAMAKSIKG